MKPLFVELGVMVYFPDHVASHLVVMRRPAFERERLVMLDLLARDKSGTVMDMLRDGLMMIIRAMAQGKEPENSMMIMVAVALAIQASDRNGDQMAFVVRIDEDRRPRVLYYDASLRTRFQNPENLYGFWNETGPENFMDRPSGRGKTHLDINRFNSGGSA